MMQTLASRLGDILASLMSRAADSGSSEIEAGPAAARMAGDGENDREPLRDDGYWWAMHAHW